MGKVITLHKRLKFHLRSTERMLRDRMMKPTPDMLPTNAEFPVVTDRAMDANLVRIFEALSTPTLEQIADELARALAEGKHGYLRPAAAAVKHILTARSGAG